MFQKKKYLELESKYTALVKEKESCIEAINLLEETIKVLENKSDKPKKSTGTQTEIMRCEECEFPAESVTELVDHLHEFHPLDGMESDENSLFNCRFCDESFETLTEVMKHNKLTHTNNVQHCQNPNSTTTQLNLT